MNRALRIIREVAAGIAHTASAMLNTVAFKRPIRCSSNGRQAKALSKNGLQSAKKSAAATPTQRNDLCRLFRSTYAPAF